MADVAKRAYDFYVAQGLAPHQAAAMVGHMIGESGGNPTIQETLKDGTKGPGYGAFQWTTPSRRAGLDTFAKSGTGVELDPNKLETQLLYSLKELDTTEKAAGDKLYGAKTYDEAVKAGMHYLRPSGYDPNNPAAGHNYAGRFNAGAGFVGEQPMMGPTMAASGSATTPETGVLAAPPLTGIDAEIADWSKMGTPEGRVALDRVVKKRQDEYAALDAGSNMLLKSGMGLLTPPKEEGFAPVQAQVHRPQPGQIAMPDFTKILAQQRLMRRT